VLRLPQEYRWGWDVGLYRVSEDHATIERLPNRYAYFHANVNRFVEPPHCSDCLMIGKPQKQADGTIKVKVILTHPFPNSPEFTGFDVRGTIMFPATRYWEKSGPPWWCTKDFKLIFEDFIPLYFSRAEDGGGQLLNADGFTMYLFPGLYIPGFDAPIFNYSKGKHANGPDPDSTVNGYKLFTNDPDRRMFLVTDTVSRTYHISPPEGEFIFGYVVDASWAKPSVMPVTDPKNDFPFWANCEDGYILDSEQLEPFKTGTYGGPGSHLTYDVTHETILTHEIDINDINSYLMCPDITSDPHLQTHGIAYGYHHENPSPGIQTTSQRIRFGTYEGPPGEYIALLYIVLNYYGTEGDYPIQNRVPIIIDFINLEVIDGEG